MSAELAIACPRGHGRLVPTVLHEVSLQEAERDQAGRHDAGVALTVHRCPICQGHFFAAGDLERVDDVVEPGLIEIRRLLPRDAQQAPLPCPACGPASAPMTKVVHRRDRKVVMDVCVECHGTWLDGGELEAIQRESLPVFLWNTVRWLADLGRRADL